MNRRQQILGVIFLPIAGVLINAAHAEYLRPRDAAAQVRQTPKLAPLRLKADLSDKILWVEQYGKVVTAYTFADGVSKYPTPRGRFRIDKVVWNPAWTPPDAKWAKGRKAKDPGRPDNPMKLVKIFFKEPDYYIHGTDELATIGSSASHGCLRLELADATDLAMRVMEAGGARKDSSWYQSAIEHGETRTVVLPRQIEMIITD
jgi:lipoprotein-anchoring transpeptidase ErfK/SrfK